jgi:AcrR family transcriptional regulator
MRQTPEKDTRSRILDVAERLFADSGFVATSLRALTTEASANLAAVHYHFGSKDELIREVLRRRIEPLNRERLELLDRLEQSSDTAGPSIEAIVEAFIGPPLRMSQDPARGGRVFMRLFGQAVSRPDPSLRGFIADQFREVAARFNRALLRAQPGLDEREAYWRMLFMIGAMAHTMTLADEVYEISGGLCDSRDARGLLQRLVAFLSAGFRASLPDTAFEDPR